MKRPIVNAEEAAIDIRQGMDDSRLMQKYRLSAASLQDLFRKMVAAGFVNQREIDERVHLSTVSVVLDMPASVQRAAPSPPVAKPAPKAEARPIPTKPTINVQNVLRDIRSGTDDADMMRKYGISAKGLQSLFRKLVAAGFLTQSQVEERGVLQRVNVVLDMADTSVARPSPKPAPPAAEPQADGAPGVPKLGVKAEQALKDIRSGMDDTMLMQRYNLPAGALESLFRKLISVGLMNPSELEERRSLAQPSVVLDLEEASFGRPEQGSARLPRPLPAVQPDPRPEPAPPAQPAPPTEPTLPARPVPPAQPAVPTQPGPAPKPEPRAEVTWKIETSSWISSRPSAESGTIYFASGDGHVFAVDLKTGEERWRRKTEGGAVVHHMVKGNTVCAVTEYGYLCAFDCATGQQRWKFAPEGGVSDCPFIAGRIVYVGSLNGTLYAVDLKTGQKKWSLRVEGTAVSSPAIAQGTICFGSDSGYVYGISRK